MRWKSALAAIGLTLSLAAAANALCMYDPSPPCQAYGRAAAVFIGTVTEVRYSAVFQTDQGDGAKWNARHRITRFKVETAFKGVDATQAEAVTQEILPTPVTLEGGEPGMMSTSHSDCHYQFKEGETYLVYAARGPKNDGGLVVGLNRTRLLSDAGDDLAYIRGLPRMSAAAQIYGTVRRADHTFDDRGRAEAAPVPNVKINVKGEGRNWETRTDAEGRYTFDGLPPGAYQVEAALPAHLAPAGRPQFAQVGARACAPVNFHTQVDGRVAGRVLDSRGRPLDEARVDLVRAGSVDEPRPRAIWAYTDKEGRYEAKGVPAGRYLLGVGLDGSSARPRTHPRLFYPGVASAAEAQVIDLDEGEKLRDYDLVLPPPPGERTVSGVVVWPDGTPVPGAWVNLTMTEYAFDEGGPSATTDAEGRFAVKALDGLRYEIKAVVGVKTPEGQRHAEPAEVPARGGVPELKLVVTTPRGNCEQCFTRRREPGRKP